MDKKSLKLFFLAAILLMLLFSIQSCTDMGYQPSGDYISGWVMIYDTNLIPGGYYAISMYANKSNPFDTLPIKSDSLKLERDYNIYKCYYRINNNINGSYYFAVTWIEYPVQQYDKLPVLGTRGCDTNKDCTNHELISFPNFTGANYNIISWADTAKNLN